MSETPKPCPEWPDCMDDEGPCLACVTYARWLDAQPVEDDNGDRGDPEVELNRRDIFGESALEYDHRMAGLD